MEYIVIRSSDLVWVCRTVEENMRKGWRCQGGIATNHNASYEPTFYQAMIKLDYCVDCLSNPCKCSNML